MCMGALPAFIYVYQKRMSDLQELELQTTVSHHVGAGNQTQVL